MEFRCFVLVEKKEDLKNSIQEFFTENVQQVFESENYTFDLYVTSKGKIKIIDFNPWAPFTLPLLFDWEELEMSSVEVGDSVAFRIVDTRCGVRPGSGWDQVFRNANEEPRMQSESPEAGA
ncbi:hypothetical protein MKX03_031821 [Papaver bracteatum]|nr:hypothetical protein MKX03_031821 [Papaver bracteatum]